MSTSVEKHHVLQFTKNVELLLQQKYPKFQDLVTEGAYQGKAAQVVLQFGEVEMQPLAKSQWEDSTAWSNVEHYQRWVLPTDFAVSLPLTRQDQVRLIGDPRSPYAENVRAAYARRYDDVVIEAATGAAKVGPYENMESSQLPEKQIITSASKGLTIEKLLQVKEILDVAENDASEERFIALTAKQVSELLNTTEVKSADYNTVRALAQGQIDTFLGFKFVRSERLLKEVATKVRTCFAWVKSGLHVGKWDEMTIKIDERADRNYVWQVYARATLGATRTAEEKVVKIECQE